MSSVSACLLLLANGDANLVLHEDADTYAYEHANGNGQNHSKNNAPPMKMPWAHSLIYVKRMGSEVMGSQPEPIIRKC